MIQKYIGHRPDLGILVLRIVIGVAFIAHGYVKFAGGIENVAGFFTTLGIPAALLMAWVVALVEFVGGLAILLGVGTRLAALLLSVVMVVAIATAKFPLGFLGGYELDVVILGSLIALLLGGSGKYAVLKERE